MSIERKKISSVQAPRRLFIMSKKAYTCRFEIHTLVSYSLTPTSWPVGVSNENHKGTLGPPKSHVGLRCNLLGLAINALFLQSFHVKKASIGLTGFWLNQ